MSRGNAAIALCAMRVAEIKRLIEAETAVVQCVSKDTGPPKRDSAGLRTGVSMASSSGRLYVHVFVGGLHDTLNVRIIGNLGSAEQKIRELLIKNNVTIYIK